MKDFVTSGLLVWERSEGFGLGEPAEDSAIWKVQVGIVGVGEDILLEVKKFEKPQKGKLIQDPMVGNATPYMDYSASIRGDGWMLLADKSTSMLGPIPGGSTILVPLNTGFGQMKLEAPP